MAGRSHAHLSVGLSGSLAGMTVVHAVVAAAHPVVRSVIELACQEADVTVTAKVETALATIAACRARTPDLLVLDLELPDSDGFKVLGDLDDEDRPQSILVLSDRADGDLVLRALRLGVRGYVTKAEGLRGLSTTIRRVLDGERVIAPGLEQDAVLALGRFARRAREGAEFGCGRESDQMRELTVLDVHSSTRLVRFERQSLCNCTTMMFGRSGRERSTMWASRRTSARVDRLSSIGRIQNKEHACCTFCGGLLTSPQHFTTRELTPLQRSPCMWRRACGIGKCSGRRCSSSSQRTGSPCERR